MDKLQQCAKAFEKLIDKQYHIIIGRKGKPIDINLLFEATDFHHLLGLHKLKDIEALSGKRETVFRNILTERTSLSMIEKSVYFNEMENRITPFTRLEQIFDDNKFIFRYNEKQNKFSSIQADYLLSTPYDNTDIYIFLAQKTQPDFFFCRSFFPKETTDYTLGQPRYTLLFKEKITIHTGQREVQYDRLSPKIKE